LQHPFIIIIVLTISLYSYYVFSKWKRNQPPAVVKKALTKYLIYFGIAGFILLAATGRLHWLFAIIASVVGAMIPLFQRFAPLIIRYLPFLANLYRQAQAAKSTQGPSQGQKSEVETQYLKMTLDHDTGDIDGQILVGQFSGLFLSALSQQQVLALLVDCQHADPDSVPLLEAYLDRKYSSEWRSDTSYENENTDQHHDLSSDMSVEEAYDILGLKSGCTKDEIIHAHRHLISKFHPDRGGSNYLASKINLAKEVLLSQQN